MSTATLPLPATPISPGVTASPGTSAACITRQTLLDRAAKQAEYADGVYDITKEHSTPLAFVDNVTGKTQLAYVRVYALEAAANTAGNNSHNLICIGRVHSPPSTPKSDAHWRVWCGDATLEGSLRQRDHESRNREAVRGFPLSKQSRLTGALRSAYASCSKSTALPQHFWGSYNAQPEKMGCKHVRHVMRDLMDRTGGIAAVLDSIEQEYDELINGAKSIPTATATPTMVTPTALPSPPTAASVTAVTTTPTAKDSSAVPATDTNVAPPTASRAAQISEQRLRGQGSMFREILDVAGPGVTWKQPVLILGESGYGKTYAARLIGKSGLYDKFYEFAVNPETDGLDFIGGPRRMSIPKADGSGDMVVDRHLDSDVISAFRDAAAGKSVLLLLDEIGNARREVLNAMKNILNPDDDHYVIKTGRALTVVNGIAKPEEIRAPVKNIAIIATTNMGSGYEANTGDRAVMNRFWKIYYEINHDEVKEVITKEATEHGFNRDDCIYLTRFYDHMKKLHEDQHCERLPNKRDFARAIRLAGDANHLPKIIARLAHEWCGEELDGTPISDQADSIRVAVKAAFAITDANWAWKP